METKEKAVTVIAEQNKVTQQLLLDYLKQTNSNLHPNEQQQFIAIASTFNLNPWKREVYAVPYGEGAKRKLSIIVGYEVYLRRAEEFPQYDGYETDFYGKGADMCCTCKVYRKDRNHATGATVFLREYAQDNSMWNKKPRVMLEKVAIATAMRRAFPSEFNGMPYTSDELPDNMTKGSEVLEQQGYTEIVAAAQESPAETTNENSAAKVHAPLSDKRKADFYTFLSKHASRLGSDKINSILEAHGGTEHIIEDTILVGEVSKEIINTKNESKDMEVEF